MAGLDWGNEDPRDGGGASFGAEDSIELPEGVEASTAGAGRGRVNPQMPVQQGPEQPLGDPMGSGAAEMLAQPPKPASVLEGLDIPEPTFDAKRATARSTRAGAALIPASAADDPITTVGPGGARAKPNQAQDMGRLASETGFAGRVVSKAAGGAAEGVFGAVRAGAELVGADKVADVAKHSAQAAADFDQGMGKPAPMRDFSPRGPMPYLQEMAEGAGSSIGQSAAFALGFGPRAVIPLLSLQSAGQQYQQARTAGKTPGEALANALPYGAFEAIGEKLGGLDKAAKALNTIVRGGTKQEIKDAGAMLLQAGVKEIPSEWVTYLGQTAVDLLPGIGLNPDLTGQQFLEGLRDTTVQAAMMGTVMGGGGAIAQARAKGAPPERSAEEIARAKGFLVRGEQIERLNKAGEKEVAGTMQRQLDGERAQSELKTLADKPWAQDPDFQRRYTELRTAGTKPAEAAARAGMATTLAGIGEGLGLQPQHIDKAVTAIEGVPLEKVPAFLERFVAGLAKRGMVPQLPPGAVEGAIGGVRDDALATQLGAVYDEDTPTATASAITDLEAQQDGAAVAPATPQGSVVAPAGFGTDDSNSNDHGAHQAAVSPENDRPEPTKAQILAGNAPLGHMNVGGLGVTVENPAGTERVDLNNDPPKWKTPMQFGYHYGYFKRSTGADGDQVDAFLRQGLPENYSGPVFVVDQVDPKTGAFDEHKVMVGPESEAEALNAYRKHYEPGWKGGAAVTRMEWDEFKEWLRDGKKTDPVGELAAATAPAAPADAAAAAGSTAAGAQPAGGEAGGGGAGGPDAVAPPARGSAGIRAARSAAWDRNPLRHFLATHGVSSDLASEFAPGLKERRSALVPGVGPIFRKAGLQLDELAQRAKEEGFLPEADADRLYDMIAAVMRGERIAPLYAEGGAEQKAERRQQAQREREAEDALTELPDDVLLDLADNDDSIPWGEVESTTTTEAAMRSLGFTQQEINDAVQAETAQGSQATPGDRQGGAGAVEAAARGAPAEDRGRSAAPRPEAPSVQELTAQVVALRKRATVLRALRECVGGAR